MITMPWGTSLPNRIALVAGAATGGTLLNAFDNALLIAGIGDLNLLRVSSIIPPQCLQVKINEITIPPGSLVPVAYGTFGSAQRGETISTAVAAAWPEDESLPGMITEFEHSGSEETAREIARQMAIEGFQKRGKALKHIEIASASIKVEQIGGVIAAAVLWWQ